MTLLGVADEDPTMPGYESGIAFLLKVHDHVAGIDQHPVALRHAFDAKVPVAGFLQSFHQLVGDGADVTVGAA